MAEQDEAVPQPDSAGDNVKAPKRKSRSKRKRPLIIVAIVVLVIVGAWAAWWLLYAQFYASTEDAYVHGNIISIAPQISGTVVSVHADDTDLVQAGEVLVQLDKTDARIAFDQAQANLAHTVRQVRQMFDQVAQMQATVALREAALNQARRDYQRARKLQEVRGISTEDFQHAHTALRSARASYKIVQHQLAAAQAATAGTTLAQQPLVRQAEARLRKAWLTLQRTVILAPAQGYVAQRHVQVGEQVGPGSKLMAVIPLENVWVEANFKETGLANVRIGQPVTLVADLYDNFTYHGHVAGLAAGTGSAFSLLPPQNATGNWIKVVQRVPVRIAIDADDLASHPLRIGLSMSVEIDTHDRSGRVLATASAQEPRLETSVYERKTDQLEALIQRIVDNNRGNGSRDMAQAAKPAG